MGAVVPFRPASHASFEVAIWEVPAGGECRYAIGLFIGKGEQAEFVCDFRANSLRHAERVAHSLSDNGRHPIKRIGTAQSENNA